LQGDGGLGIGDWALGIGDWAQSPIPNPQSPIPNPHSINIKYIILFYYINDFLVKQFFNKLIFFHKWIVTNVFHGINIQIHLMKSQKQMKNNLL